MNKTASIILILAFVISLGIIFGGNFGDSGTRQNVEIKDGVQYVTVGAQGGYVPKVSIAQAGIPTKLIMETSETFDCSSSLVIKDLNYQNFLAPNTKTEIDIGAWEAGEKMQGLCSMGMYSFQIKFE
ncbi:hypothetical protein COU49_01955 [Candidatus Nomurabacteria bacterium CG10_big_fil_rev_8_21_14_0_10_35_16]|uniref:EfeO-type cupredoxin-like domain-containing protein n=1 Tax=Candidatus Nomurabacteria bacterium CG10_big_fil_rev_8_21_14_0_10_35_16 TaxID=1974731 RepID=A0A2H0TBB5_9BACT|nr:MAG: hypothetical protein COU49_01955 [Candidatus Nomurabacteria bacterium CG10_big_fil_rev_8_21_14_0_10_35_16]